MGVQCKNCNLLHQIELEDMIQSESSSSVFPLLLPSWRNVGTNRPRDKRAEKDLSANRSMRVSASKMEVRGG